MPEGNFRLHYVNWTDPAGAAFASCRLQRCMMYRGELCTAEVK